MGVASDINSVTSRQAVESPRPASRARLPFTPANAPKDGVQFNQETATRRVLKQVEASFGRLVQSINVSKFNPDQIETLIRRAEANYGAALSESEKQRIRRSAESKNPYVLRLLALELGVGVPEKEEAEAQMAFGQMFLHRGNREELNRFVNDASVDENLRAHVRAMLLFDQVENMMYVCERWRYRIGSIGNALKIHQLLSNPGTKSRGNSHSSEGTSGDRYRYN